MNLNNGSIISEEYVSDEQILQNKKQLADEEFEKLQKIEKEVKMEIDKLENKISETEKKKRDVQKKLNEQIEAISQQKQEILIFDAKIAFITRKINKHPQQQDDKIREMEVLQDNAYLNTLLTQKEKLIATLKQKISNIKLEAIQEKDLQQLQNDLFLKKEQLKEIKNQQEFGNLNKSQQNIKQKLQEVQDAHNKRLEILQEIQKVNSNIRKEQDHNQVLLNQIQIVETIYRTYENRVEQQNTMIKNLEQELPESQLNNQF